MDYLSHLRVDGERLIAAARHAPDARVVSCPAWDVTALVAHTGAIYEWVADIIRRGERGTPRRRRPEDEPAVFPEVARAFDESLAGLLDAFEGADPDHDVWNWFDGAPAPARFWFRRMAQETVVHRWDAEDAATEPAPIDTALAADGIDEYLMLLAKILARRPHHGLLGTLTLRPTDGDGSWDLDLAPDRVERRAVAGLSWVPDAVVSGPTSELYLWVLHRANSTEISGDAAWWDEIRFE